MLWQNAFNVGFGPSGRKFPSCQPICRRLRTRPHGRPKVSICLVIQFTSRFVIRRGDARSVLTVSAVSVAEGFRCRGEAAAEVGGEAGCVGVTDSRGDGTDRGAGAAEQIGGFLQTQFDQVVAETDSQLIAEQARQMSGTATGDVAGQLRKSNRFMEVKGEIRTGPRQRIARKRCVGGLWPS